MSAWQFMIFRTKGRKKTRPGFHLIGICGVAIINSTRDENCKQSTNYTYCKRNSWGLLLWFPVVSRHLFRSR